MNNKEKIDIYVDEFIEQIDEFSTHLDPYSKDIKHFQAGYTASLFLRTNLTEQEQDRFIKKLNHIIVTKYFDNGECDSAKDYNEEEEYKNDK